MKTSCNPRAHASALLLLLPLLSYLAGAAYTGNRTQLHVHLDGSVSQATLFKMAQVRNLTLPVVGKPTHERDIGILLALHPGFGAFDVVNNIMGGDPRSLSLAAEAFVETQAAQNITYVEVRYDPVRAATSNYTNPPGQGISQEAATAAIAAGLRAGMKRHPQVVAYQLLCAMRGKPASACLAVAALAAKVRSGSPGGVVGLDLAGDEWAKGNDNTQYIECFRHAKHDLGLNTTVHVGETLPWPLKFNRTVSEDDVYSALLEMNVDRIGHGYAASKNATFLAAIRARGVHLESCPYTANGESSIQAIKDYLRNNMSFSINTDDPCMGCNDHPRPLSADEDITRSKLGFTDADISRAHEEGRRHGFGTWVAERYA